MRLYLLRHGHQENNSVNNLSQRGPDPELSSIGRRQADLLGQHLKEHRISAIYASDSKRAVQTAEIVNNRLCVPLEKEPNLREIDMGEVSLKGWDKIAIEYPDFSRKFQQHNSDIAYPGGESGLDVQQRVMPVLEDILTHHPQGSNLALVCHGGVIMVLLTASLGMPQEQRFRFQIDYCSISIIEYDSIKQSFQVLSVNDTSHLEMNPEE